MAANDEQVVSRRARERLNRVADIQDVAERLFAQKGFFHFTMKELARRAEYALGTIYSIFRSKRQLYELLVERKATEMVRFVTEQMRRESTPAGQLEKYVEAKLEFFRQNLDFLRLYFAETYGAGHRENQVSARSLQEKRTVLTARLVEVFERGIEDGTFIPSQARALARALEAWTDGFVLSWIETGQEDSPASGLESVKRVFLSGVLVNSGLFGSATP